MQDVKQKEETTYFWEDDTLVVYLARELDHHNAEGIKENVDLSVISKGVKRVVFDFSKTVWKALTEKYLYGIWEKKSSGFF